MLRKYIICILIMYLAVAYGQVLFAGARSVPKMLNCQGYLTDTLGSPIEDTLDITFKIYDAATLGNELWSETQTNVPVERGVFSVLLGSGTPIPDTVFTTGTDRWLELTLEGTQTLSPRTRITAVGYAYTSTYSDTAEYARNAAADNDWVRGTPDSVLFTANYLGVSRGSADNMLYGDSVHTHSNLGVACTTGTNGFNYSYITISGGRYNIASHNYTTIAGGYHNIANDYGSTVGGGFYNTADSSYAAVGGGYDNSANGLYATVGGGRGNTADSSYAAVGGGQFNTASGDYATVGGGYYNYATGSRATVAGGYSNTASGAEATVGGGYQNSASYDYATVAGGYSNTASNLYATVGGGYYNTASYDYATVGGGRDNTASDNYATVGGGRDNTASLYATVGGGGNNTASGYMATVGGGGINTASYDYATVGGGIGDTVNARYGGVAAGYSNLAGDAGTDTAAFVGGGYNNSATAKYATVGGGYYNTASYDYATVGGGWSNDASYDYATVGGGWSNTASYYYATVGGGAYNTASGNRATVAGGSINSASGAWSSIAGGSDNTCAALDGFVANSFGDVLAGHSNSTSLNGQTTTASGQTRIGILSKASGSFTIDHPTEPMDRILNHYFVESPEMVLIYRGVAIIGSDGRAEVHLPDYFDALNRNPMVQLTGVGTSDVYVAEKVTGNHFVIGGKPGTEVYWTVTGERKDQSAEITRILMPVEQLKEGDLAGHSLDDDFLATTMSQLERMGQAGKFTFRTAEGQEKYERSLRVLE